MGAAAWDRRPGFLEATRGLPADLPPCAVAANGAEGWRVLLLHRGAEIALTRDQARRLAAELVEAIGLIETGWVP